MPSSTGTTSSTVLAKRGRSTRSGAPGVVNPKGRRTAKGRASCSFGGATGSSLSCSALLMEAFNSMFETRALSHMLSAVELRNLSLVARPFRHFQKQIWRLTKWTDAAREALVKGSLPLLMELDTVGKGCGKPLAPALTKLKYLHTLRLERPELLAADIRGVGKKLKGLPRLTTLELISFDFRRGTDAMDVFMEGLADARSLRRLHWSTELWDTSCGAGLQALGRALNTLPTLESLTLRRCSRVLPTVAGALPHLRATLLELDVELHYSDDNAARTHFLQALPVACCLKVLRLVGYKLEAQSALLGQALSVMSKLEKLKLHIGTSRSGVMEAHIAPAIANLCDLRELDINMKLGAADAAAMASALQGAHTLIVLILSDCGLGDEGCKALAAGLGGKNDANLTHLDLSSNGVGVEGGAVLASLISSLPHLRRLTLVSLGQPYALGQDLGAAGTDLVAPLACAAATLPVLEELDFSCNPASEEGIGALARLITSSRTLRTLKMRLCMEPSLLSVFVEELSRAEHVSTVQELYAGVRGDDSGGELGDLGADKVEAALSRLANVRSLCVELGSQLWWRG